MVNAENAANLKAPISQRKLSPDDAYPCPVCRQGQLEALVLMDVFACSFCRSMLTVNWAQQSVQGIERDQGLHWYWTGQRWQSSHQRNGNLALMVWVMGSLLVICPTAIIWLSAYMFPPLTGSSTNLFAQGWAGLTLCLHGGMAIWLLSEHYQLPFWVAIKVHITRYQQAFRDSFGV